MNAPAVQKRTVVFAHNSITNDRVDEGDPSPFKITAKTQHSALLANALTRRA